ncbi:D-inositol 3-phosphate glycosyltransferase (plasmid) [Antarctobacter heliothermus]|uniref:D-inositol 3-phosphate glycosyltransferase n=1 Tax=Antarctobacter heliothermus TaxID=74033 RepID=A0A222EBS6_9RHOB|nr:glycosyltransferase family 4 protein [Antarctobacter heliothermus]ASP23592.1 D-inositol 3-phosphate glycosyltransferase [Antarctobacter heliothermus]
MKLLAISEHYYPRVGGTVNYVHETLCALAGLGVDAELLVPGPAPDGWQPQGMAEPPYTVTWIDAGYPAKGDPSREQRYDFCRQVDSLALERASKANGPDVLHVLFGLFVMEVLDTGRLRAAGLPCFSTVHNVPPMECRQTAHNAPLFARMKEELRLKAVGLKNRTRLRKNRYDLHIVPSEQVKGFLEPVVKDPITAIGHGLTSDLQALMTPPATRLPEGPVRLLTVGGYAPHKRQHIIPETATRLRDAGVDFIWEIAGPSGRVRGYFDDIRADIAARGLQDSVIAHASVPFRDLGALYDRANIYVQPSIEEGFCLTALDAAAVGLPVIGCRAGALPEIIAASGGALVQSAPKPLARAITDFVQGNRWQDPVAQAARVKGQFSWTRAAADLKSHYDRLTA